MRVRGVLLRRKTLGYFLSEQFRAPCYRCGRRYRWKKYSETSFGPYGASAKRHYCCEREGLIR